MLPVVETFAQVAADPFFVQIGAHDGTQQDPLQDVILRNEWPGILVEPVPFVFQRLQANYGHIPGVILENVAVGVEDGTLPLYHLASSSDSGRRGLPEWFDALGSLDREVIMAHRRMIPDLAERLVEISVPVLSFTTLMKRHQVRHIDVMLVDTEGYDGKILGSIDFQEYRAKLIIYESIHLSSEEQAATLARLHAAGYLTAAYGLDTWCLNPRALTSTEHAQMLAVWQWAVTRAPQQRLLITRVAQRAAETLRARTRGSGGFTFPLTERERSYLEKGYDDSTPLPVGAERVLSPENSRLFHLRRIYAGLDLPATAHSLWDPERVSQAVKLRYFRGDNLYQWHYPDHPRAMALSLFSYMRYLESCGGRELLDRVSEDGAFGCWTAEVPGYGKISRDLLDSVSEALFLSRELDLFRREKLKILDIGAGYGRLAHRMSSLHPSLEDYCCVDAVPESTFLSEYYLEFRNCTPPARVVSLDQFEASLAPSHFDLAVNVHSFSEMPLAAMQWWMTQVARLEIPHLFIVPNEYEGIISREADGTTTDGMPVILAAGYRQIAKERVIQDPAVREFIRINDNFYLFEREQT
jgi:putative sugar O-methyltransferase